MFDETLAKKTQQRNPEDANSDIEIYGGIFKDCNDNSDGTNLENTISEGKRKEMEVLD